MTNPEIFGHYNADGSIKDRPAVDINGTPYDVMLSTARVGKDLFVVLPVNFSNHTLLESIRAEYGGKPAPKAVSDEN